MMMILCMQYQRWRSGNSLLHICASGTLLDDDDGSLEGSRAFFRRPVVSNDQPELARPRPKRNGYAWKKDSGILEQGYRKDLGLLRTRFFLQTVQRVQLRLGVETRGAFVEITRGENDVAGCVDDVEGEEEWQTRFRLGRLRGDGDGGGGGGGGGDTFSFGILCCAVAFWRLLFRLTFLLSSDQLDYSGCKEEKGRDEYCHNRRNDEAGQKGFVLIARRADVCENVSVERAHCEDYNREAERREPDVEVMEIFAERHVLLGPIHCRNEEPLERQEHPPKK